MFMSLGSVWQPKVGIFSTGITRADAKAVVSFHVYSEVKWDTELPPLFPPVILFFCGIMDFLVDNNIGWDPKITW